MTESEWLAGTDPQEMLDFLSGKASDRKLRLFAVACCRRIEQLLPDAARCRAAISRAAQIADGPRSGPAPCTQLVVTATACTAAFAAAAVAASNAQDADEASALAAHAAYSSSCVTGTGNADEEAVELIAEDARAVENFDAEELASQADLLRHIVGNPFRPPLLHVAANVRALAETAYQQNPTAVGPLHDALLDAGLAEWAGHFADEREGHPKGCWVIDRLLGKE